MTDHEDNESHLDRRQFSGRLAAFGSALATSLLGPQTAVATESPLANAAAPQNLEGDAKTVQRPPNEILLLTYVTQRYPSEHFDEPVLRGIFNDIRHDQTRGRILSDFPLKNSDEPSGGFRAYRAAD